MQLQCVCHDTLPWLISFSLGRETVHMRTIAIAFAILGAAICAFVAWRELASVQPRFIELGNLVVLTMTLVVLVWYAYDTNAIARVTRDRWAREGILGTTYNLTMPG